ncbi:hypothetical protein BJ166DRAFT_531509 [Pestalotiopsis sp. NC0098]|nr:hypothetical protein BJ166DRAFT_531509 [Pestalotiopsis sp. NC0098]
MATSRPPKSSHSTKSAADKKSAATTPAKTMPPTAGLTGTSAPDTAATTANDENIYQTCLSKLTPLTPVLAGFNHRNRSQHRHARWWAAFGVVRRGTARLVTELEPAYALSKKAHRKKRKRQDGEGGDGGDGKKKKDPVEIRAVWIRDHAAPRAYRAFSQLAADNQFAVLGLALLGVLATVRDVCVRLVGEGEVHPPVLVAAPETRNVDGAAAAVAGKTPTPAAVGAGSADLGQVVSREEVAAALASSASASSIKTKADTQRNKTDAPPVGTDEETAVFPPPVKRKKKDPNPSLSKESPSLTPAPKTDGGEKKRKKKPDVGLADMDDDDDDKAKKKTKKKKKSKGDEFDALFSSLV